MQTKTIHTKQAKITEAIAIPAPAFTQVPTIWPTTPLSLVASDTAEDSEPKEDKELIKSHTKEIKREERADKAAANAPISQNLPKTAAAAAQKQHSNVKTNPAVSPLHVVTYPDTSHAFSKKIAGIQKLKNALIPGTLRPYASSRASRICLKDIVPSYLSNNQDFSRFFMQKYFSKLWEVFALIN